MSSFPPLTRKLPIIGRQAETLNPDDIGADADGNLGGRLIKRNRIRIARINEMEARRFSPRFAIVSRRRRDILQTFVGMRKRRRGKGRTDGDRGWRDFQLFAD